MTWEIGISRQAEKFLKQHRFPDSIVIEPVRRAIQRLQGKAVSINMKRLSGKWKDCFRIRVGKDRIIFSIDFEKQKVLIEVIDNRGQAYK